MNVNPKEAEALFEQTLRVRPEERAAFLASACGDDPALRQRVEELLAADRDAGSFLPTKPRLPGTIVIPITEQPGDRIGRYKLRETLGEGGCGVVYVAEQEEPVRRCVALKVIKLGMDTRDVIARFEAERQALAIMDHPNIAKVFDAGATDAGRPYFVMELVRGVRITDYCDENRLSTRARLELFIKVCRAVQHAHQKGIIHRDIKPSNILVTLHDGVPVPKVIDFGIAKATQGRLTNATVYTELHQFIGTPAYMSPEQAEMSGLDIDTRSDIYSLGVLLYELLTSKTPFNARELLAAGVDAIRRTLREWEPPRPSTMLATLPRHELTTTANRRSLNATGLVRLLRGDLDWIVMKCLEKDRTRRYDTANGLGQDILRHLQNEPVIARPPSTGYKMRKAWRRNKLTYTAATTVAAGLAIGLGVSTVALKQEREARQRATAAERSQSIERANAEQARNEATIERDRASVLLSRSQAEHGVKLLEAGDPAGLLYLVQARESAEHLPEERIRRTLLWSAWMDSLPKAQVILPENTNPGNRVFTNLKQPWLANGTTNGEIIIQDAVTGAQTAKFKAGHGAVSASEISDNGRLLVVNADGARQLWMISSNTAPQRLVTGISRHAFDMHSRRIVTLANEGLRRRGEDRIPSPEQQARGFRLQVWDSLADVPLVSEWEGNRSDLSNHQLAVSPDGSKVAAGWRSMAVWDAITGQKTQPEINTNSWRSARGFEDPLLFSPNGSWLWDVRGRVCLRYDLATGEVAGEAFTNLHQYARPWVAPNRRHLVLTLDRGFHVVELDTGNPIGPVISVTDGGRIRALALSVDGHRLVAAIADQTVRVWNTLTGQAVGEKIVLPGAPAGAVFSPAAESLVISTRDGQSIHHSLALQPSTAVQSWRKTRVLGFNPQGHLLAYFLTNRSLQWLEPATAKPITPAWPLPDRGALVSSALTLDATLLATLTATGKNSSAIRFCVPGSGSELEPSITWTNGGLLAFSPNGKILAVLSGLDASIHLWDVPTRQPRGILPLPKPMEVSWAGMDFSPDGRFIVMESGFRTLHVWDVEARQLVNGAFTNFYMAISADWKFALTGREILDFTDPRRPRPLSTAAASAASERGGFAISPDGRLRAAGTRDNAVRLWNVSTGQPVGQELKPVGMLSRMWFSPDSRLLITSDYPTDLGTSRSNPNAAVRLWDTATGLPCGRPVEKPGMLPQIIFDPRREFFAISHHDATHVFKLPAQDVPLEQMQRESWLASGSRLDETGNLETIPSAELKHMRAAARNDNRPKP